MLAIERIRSLCVAFGRSVKVKAPTASTPIIRSQRGDFVICLTLTWLSMAHVALAADNQRAREIVDRAARLFASQSSIATVEMQITKEDFQRQISMQLWSVDEAKILVRIHQPQEDAGTAILKVADKTWLYLPKANRTVAMPASMMATSWMGSDFTLNDLVNQSRLSDDYMIATTFEGQRDGVAVSEYTLTPRPAAVVVWGKIVLEIREADLMPIWQRYYDEDGMPVRELSFSDYKTVSTSSRFGRLIPTRLVMRRLNQTGEQTTITYKDIVFDQPISEDIFSLRNLKQ